MVIHALETQRRGTKAGEIRLGARNEKGNPISLEHFRLTTKWERVAETVAEKFGGKPNWTQLANGEKTIEVMTETANLPVLVPPSDAVITQWREMWGNGFCARRCDSITEMKSKQPCMCPIDDAERKELAKSGKACKDTTRLSLMLPDICTGVWKVVTGSGNAAVELSDSTDLLGAAADQGIWLPATARLDRRVEKYLVNGKPQTNKFPVITLIPNHSPVQIMSGEIGSGIAAALPSITNLAIGSGSQERSTQQSDFDWEEELATPEQKKVLRERINELSPVEKTTFNTWVANEKTAGGIHSFSELRRDEVALVSAKLDVLMGWVPDIDNEPVDAEIIDEGAIF